MLEFFQSQVSFIQAPPHGQGPVPFEKNRLVVLQERSDRLGDLGCARRCIGGRGNRAKCQPYFRQSFCLKGDARQGERRQYGRMGVHDRRNVRAAAIHFKVHADLGGRFSQSGQHLALEIDEQKIHRFKSAFWFAAGCDQQSLAADSAADIAVGCSDKTSFCKFFTDRDQFQLALQFLPSCKLSL